MWGAGFIRSFHCAAPQPTVAYRAWSLRVQPERQILHGVEGEAAACASARFASERPKLGRGTDIALLVETARFTAETVAIPDTRE
jgi:hypothetical protein